VKLLILLAPRKTALAHLRRSHLDDDSNPILWTTPHELTKSKKTVLRKRTYLTPLPPLAQRILKGVPNRDDAPDLVFPGRHKGIPLDPGTPLSDKLIDLGAPKDFNFHAVRHTIATWLQNEGHSDYEVGLVLNHSGKGGVTAGYSHGYSLDLRRRLLQKWADHVEKLVTAEGVALLR
jgi:integrase